MKWNFSLERLSKLTAASKGASKKRRKIDKRNSHLSWNKFITRYHLHVGLEFGVIRWSIRQPTQKMIDFWDIWISWEGENSSFSLEKDWNIWKIWLFYLGSHGNPINFIVSQLFSHISPLISSPFFHPRGTHNHNLIDNVQKKLEQTNKKLSEVKRKCTKATKHCLKMQMESVSRIR